MPNATVGGRRRETVPNAMVGGDRGRLCLTLWWGETEGDCA